MDKIKICNVGSSSTKIAERKSKPGCEAINLSKSRCVSIDEVGKDGLPLLGTYIGSAEPRRRFLDGMMGQNVDKLHGFDVKEAFLLLSKFIPLELGHLPRSLRTEDLPGVWNGLDMALHDVVRTPRMRKTSGRTTTAK